MRVGVGCCSIDPLGVRYVNQVLKSGRLSYGPFHRRFERSFAREHQSLHSVFCNSGTSALHIALQALKELHGWKDGDEVLVPAITFVATANIVLHNRLTPVFVDVEENTYNINPDEIEQHITRRTRAIIPVHLLGLPADMAPIMWIAKTHNLAVIEDSCETMFVDYRGRRVGSFGDIGCFSTYVAHLLTTGVGGLAITSNPELHIKLRSLMNHGRDSIYLNIDDKGSEVIERRFNFVSVGHSFRATEMEAALGMAAMRGRHRMIRRRQENAALLTRGLRDLALQLPRIPSDRDHAFMMYGILTHGDKRHLVRYLESKGIETRDILPLINQPIYKKLYGELESKYPAAKRINRSGFYIGCHQGLTRQQIDYTVDMFWKFRG